MSTVLPFTLSGQKAAVPSSEMATEAITIFSAGQTSHSVQGQPPISELWLRSSASPAMAVICSIVGIKRS